MIAANPYCYYYDTLLLLVPGVTIYVDDASYRSRGSRAIGIGCAASILVLGYVTVLVVKGGVAWTGALVSVWLLAEAYDLWPSANDMRARPVAESLTQIF